MLARARPAVRIFAGREGEEEEGRIAVKNVIGFNWIADREEAPLFIFRETRCLGARG